MALNEHLWVAYIGKDSGHVEVISSSDGKSWSKSMDTGQSSGHAPAITGHQGRLWIAYIGKDSGHVELISSSDDGSWSKSTDTGQSSGHAPLLPRTGAACGQLTSTRRRAASR